MVHSSRGPEDARLIRAAREVNDAKMHHVLARATEMVKANPTARVGYLGLAFKANIATYSALFRRKSTAMRSYTTRGAFGQIIARFPRSRHCGWPAEMNAASTAQARSVCADWSIFQNAPAAAYDSNAISISFHKTHRSWN